MEARTGHRAIIARRRASTADTQQERCRYQWRAPLGSGRGGDQVVDDGRVVACDDREALGPVADQAVLDRVLDTTLALHGEHGYASTVDDVADQADVRKTTIYRRWPRRRPTSLLRWRDLRPCRFPNAAPTTRSPISPDES
ncbi:MAG: TetR family transcriptional regulator [Actinobacteria bacterium]|nr:TetR family transcriptional regulator [Actinomycetota bacterium]